MKNSNCWVPCNCLIVMTIGLIFFGSGCPPKQGPTAWFAATPLTGPAPLQVQFEDQSEPGSEDIVAWFWDFGDGLTSTEVNPIHTYQNAGLYTVSLSVTTDVGEDTWFREDYIEVLESGEGEGEFPEGELEGQEPEGEGQGEGEGELPEGEGQEEGEGESGGFVEVPDPLSGHNPVFPLQAVSVPSSGQSIFDPDFGLAQRRVTRGLKVRQEYSRHDPFNADHSFILLTDIASGDWRVYRTASVPYDTDAQAVTTLSLEEPRWDPADPNVIWGTQEFRILTVNMLHPEDQTVIKDFAEDPAIQPVLAANPDLYRITMKDEGESSADKRYWAFILQGVNQDYRARYIFCWDRQADDVVGVYTLPLAESDLDWVGMSYLGNWVLIGGMETNSGNLAGLTMANRELTQFHRLDYTTSHADIGLDSAGNEVIVMQNNRTDYIDMIPLSVDVQPILEAGGSYAGTNRIPVIRLFYDSEDPQGLNSGVHISCNMPGYAVVSTYIAPDTPAQNWLDRKIVVVKLDAANPRTFYLAKVYGTRGEYWEETQATVATDGSRIVWATNWNQNVGQENVWVMQLSLPVDWPATMLQ
ncbi:MAG TPA: PKD domain-containing protein [Candidatus Hydrogenedentes bacterium]|nr:PKD domain-containing protein [Candidatus Hydrogenedentota bacterium]